VVEKSVMLEKLDILMLCFSRTGYTLSKKCHIIFLHKSTSL
jgi:hypothetical protein